MGTTTTTTTMSPEQHVYATTKATFLSAVGTATAVNNKKAAFTLTKSLICFVFGIVVLLTVPTVLLPVSWLLLGAASVGLFAIATDCGHDNYFTSSILNRIVGTLCLLPLLYPLETLSSKPRAKKPILRVVVPIFWVLDLCRGIGAYFDLSKFSGDQQNRARVSVAAVYVFCAIFFPLVVGYAGWWALVKFYLGPWFAFHVVKSLCFSDVSPTVFDAKKEAIRMQYCSLPWPIEWLVNTANFQVPYSLSVQIPCYNLAHARAAVTASSLRDAVSLTSWIDVVRRMLFKTSLKEQYAAFARRQQYLDDMADAPTRKAKARVQAAHLAANAAIARMRATDPDLKTLAQRMDPVRSFTWSRKGFVGLAGFLKREVNWLHTPLLTLTPMIGLYGLATHSAPWSTWMFAVFYYFVTAIGITGGYHRLWSHRAYDAAWPVRLVLLCCASGAVEGSCRWWCRDHRAHHRFTDTPKDPYSIKNGFFYAHVGWMLLKQDKKQIGHADISDLNADAMIRFQHRHYLLFALFFGFLLPTLVCGLGWGDWRGGFLIAGVARLVFVHHATFCVNSLAHYVGELTYSDVHSPRDHVLTALMTVGEGYHAFHHQFPEDYRNGIRYYHYDPTKVLIRTLAFFGLAYNLHRFPANEIRKGKFQMALKRLAAEKRRIDWGPNVASLPVMTVDDVAQDSRQLMIINDLVVDVTDFLQRHPGGKVIAAFVRKDATAAFTGTVYMHSAAAHNLLHTMRVGRLPDKILDAETVRADHGLAPFDDEPMDEEDVVQRYILAFADSADDHGPLAHVDCARLQDVPIGESPYEIDFAQ